MLAEQTGDSVSLFELLNYAKPEEIEELAEAIRKFETGEWNVDQFKKFRLSRGTYGQRQEGVNMIRIKIPQGILTAEQLECVGEISAKYSRGFGHVTTRQNIQLHFCKLGEVPQVQERLTAVGLTTREACGNTIRNVTACPYSGVAPSEVFDVTPYAQALTRHFLRNPICQDLPRKFKIAFSCGHDGDCAQGAINDIGLLAKIQDGVRGFRVTVGGGLSTSPEDGHVLAAFVPADELLPLCEAVVRLFDQAGNRQNKARARFKYVIRKLGWAETEKKIHEELGRIRAEGRAHIPIEIERAEVLARRRLPVDGAAEERALEFQEWKGTATLGQKQPGYFAVTIRLVRGDITAPQLLGLARLLRERGDSMVRTTNQQNLVARNVPSSDLAAFWRGLVELGLAKPGANTIGDVTACPGAESCNLAVTASRELASSITQALENANGHSAAVEAASDLDIKISGCPNSCGQHHIAGIGFHGTVRRIGGKAMPEYQLHLGGGISPEGATFGRQIIKIPAHRISEAVLRLLELYRLERTENERPRAFFQRVTEQAVQHQLADLAQVDETTVKPEEFSDLGTDSTFAVKIGQGECAA